jgi:hypothetical protein
MEFILHQVRYSESYDCQGPLIGSPFSRREYETVYDKHRNLLPLLHISTLRSCPILTNGDQQRAATFVSREYHYPRRIDAGPYWSELHGLRPASYFERTKAGTVLRVAKANGLSRMSSQRERHHSIPFWFEDLIWLCIIDHRSPQFGKRLIKLESCGA